jgi:hypothetical protein
VNTSQENKKIDPKQIYPEPFATGDGYSPFAYSQIQSLEKSRSKHVYRLILVLVALLVVAGLVFVGMKITKGTKPINSKASTASKIADNTSASLDSYYLPNDSYKGPYVYKFSGTLKTSLRDGTTETFYISEFFTKDFTVTFSRNSVSECPKDSKGNCYESYKTPRGHTVYPSKNEDSSGGTIEIDGATLRFTNVKLGNEAQKTDFNTFADSLKALRSSQVAAYDKSYRQKLEWQALFALPFPIYSPKTTPNNLPLIFNGEDTRTDVYGPSKYLESIYSTKVSIQSLDNALTTYEFFVRQLQKPATFNATKSCAIGIKKYACSNVSASKTSTGETVTVDESKYKLYVEASTNTAIADYGKTILLVESLGPVGISKTDLGAAVIKTLNSMEPTKPEDLQYISTNMNTGI